MVLQQSVHTTADGAFDRCPALERIVMRSDRPSECRVGQGLLDGMAAKVYVPSEALSRYRADYFRSVYAADTLPDGS